MANLQSYGFVDLEDLASQRVATVGVEVINTAVMDSVDAWQAELDGILENFVDRVTWAKRKYWLPSAGTLQPLDQHGNPKPRIPSGNYDIGLPIQGGGDAWGDNRVSRAMMTVQEADRFTAMVLQADTDWMIRHILAAWFTNTSWVYPDEIEGNVTVMPLANNDTVTYVRRNGLATIDTHFLAQANAIGNSDNPFPTIYTELSEHPSNSGPFVAYVNGTLATSVAALANFREVGDPDIEMGADSDRLVGQLANGFGDEILGKVDKMWIVQWDRLPDNYIPWAALGNSSKPFAMREYDAAELQGFFPEFHNIDGNRHLNKFIRLTGFGAQNRVAAGVTRIGNGTYAIPTGFTAPLPV